ncbi:hypothetical protein I5L01_15650, partial [Erythrobacter sp. YJ-T3-07]|uniref:hypothetical protein n=1 Tax=Erythrobacter sp. YJ-T3-07 TaxID=2793063 RepID=UPI0018D4A613
MPGLPDGWEADYNGSRWLYRYKATGPTQFTFPKAGDEFPEHLGMGSGMFDLAPEERLASEQQIKRRSTLDGTQSDQKHPNNRRTFDHLDDIDEKGATGYFDPSSFMYFGPDISNGDLSITTAA